MNRTLLLLLSLLAFCAGKAQGKNNDSICVDTAKYHIMYDVRYVNDVHNRPYQYEYDEYRLDIGRAGVTLFFSYRHHFRLIWLREMYKKTGEMMMREAPEGGMLNMTFLTNYPEKGQTYYNHRISPHGYYIVEQDEIPQWEIVADSVKQILGYACQMAKTEFHGRTWLAYYAEEIPLSEGPWKLRGLPGLVLEARDSKNQYIFTATSIEEERSSKPMKKTDWKEEKVTWKQLRKIMASNDMNASVKAMFGLDAPTGSRGHWEMNPLELK